MIKQINGKPYRGKLSSWHRVNVGNGYYITGICEEYVNPANNWNGIKAGRPMYTSMVLNEFGNSGLLYVETMNSIYELAVEKEKFFGPEPEGPERNW